MTENAQRNREAEVNLLAAAREAQWSVAAFMGPNTMKLVSPAKVNLLLAIGARREDGYHDADTIMHALALHDTLYLRAEGVSADELAKRVAEGGARADVAVGGPADNLVMTIDLADRTGQDLAVPAADNLAFKAADRLSRAVGRDLPEAIQLRIEKRIPARAAWAAARRTRRRYSWALRRRGALRPMTSAWPTLPGRSGPMSRSSSMAAALCSAASARCCSAVWKRRGAPWCW